MPRAVDGMKECTKCHKVKPVSGFYRKKASFDGLRGHCKACEKAYRDRPEVKARQKAYGKVYRKGCHKAYWDEPEAKARDRERRRIRPHRYWASRTIYGHRRSGYTVNITVDQLEPIAKRTTHCPICDVALAWELGCGYVPNSPTLDRKDNGSTMTIDNTWIICRNCNTSKSSRTMDELIEYCGMVWNKFGGD